MPCFCPKILGALPPSFAKMKLDFSPPKIPIALRAAAALPQLDDPQRIDARIAATMASIRTPAISPHAGAVLGLAAQLKIAGGVFTIDDLPKLDAELKQSAYTINRFVLPKLRLLARLNPLPIIQLGMVAKLKMSLDPIEWDSPGSAESPVSHSIDTGFRLSPPALALGKMIAGIPPLVDALAPMKLSIADPGTPGVFLGHLKGLASMQMPQLDVPLGELLTLAAILDSLATIEEAFGASAMTPAGLSQIAAKLNLFMRMPLPNPMPDLGLAEHLKLLPMPEDIKYGADAAGSGIANFGFSPPKIAVMPFISAVLALRASLNNYLKLDPLDACGTCEAPLPMFA